MSPEPAETDPDPKTVAEEVREERKGRGGRRSTSEQRSRWRAAKRRQRGQDEPADAPEEERGPIVVTQADIAVAGTLGGVIWDLSTPFTKHRSLTEEEKGRFGEALAPVIAKYAPLLGQYAEEAALVICLFDLWQRTSPPKTAKAPPAEPSPVPPSEAAQFEIVETAHDGVGTGE